MKSQQLILGLLSLSLFAGSAVAGSKYAYPITITSTSASGSMGTARNSADLNQFIGCSVQATSASYVVACSALDPAGNFASCITNDAAMANAALTVKGDSLVRFDYATNGGACTFISINNSSYLAVPLP